VALVTERRATPSPRLLPWWHVWRLAAIRSSMQGPPDLRRPTHRLDQPSEKAMSVLVALPASRGHTEVYL
jgi:hypothetical protein